MAVNQKAIKVLNKIFEAGFTDEKEISAMTMDDILSMQGIARKILNFLKRNMVSAAVRISIQTVHRAVLGLVEKVLP